MAYEPGALLGTGKTAEVREWTPGWVIKLSLTSGDEGPAQREAGILTALAPLGIAPATGGLAQCNGHWGVIIERLTGPVLGDSLANPAEGEAMIGTMLDLHRRIHSHVAPPGLPQLKTRLVRNISLAPHLDDDARRDLLVRLDGLPDGNRLCHGDFHPFNIMGDGAGSRIIDWLDASAGDPAADVCRTYVLASSRDPGLAAAYVAAYTRSAGIDEAAILAWLSVVAAARLAENLPQEEDHLLAMAQGRWARQSL